MTRFDPTDKWTKNLNKYSSKENMQMAKKHMEKCSVSLVIQKMQIKITIRYHLIPTRVRKSNNSKYWWDVGKSKSSYIAKQNAKWSSCFEKESDVFLQSIKHRVINWPAFALLGRYTPKRNNICSHKNLCMNIYSSIIVNSQKSRNAQMSINRQMSQ